MLCSLAQIDLVYKGCILIVKYILNKKWKFDMLKLYQIYHVYCIEPDYTVVPGEGFFKSN